MSQKSLLCMCVYDTEENGRYEFTERTLEGLAEVISIWQPILIVNNASTDLRTVELLNTYDKFFENIEVLHLPTNLGTAGGLNEGIKRLQPGQHLIKIDNDVIVHDNNWIDKLEFIVERAPQIGMVALKRRDLLEAPYNNEGPFKSLLHMLPHEPGEPWYLLEQVKHVMGTCVLYSNALLEKVGGFYQFDVYGFEDSLMSYRSTAAGFVNMFLPHIVIDHIDTGGTPYQKEKEAMAGKWWADYEKEVKKIMEGDYYFDVNKKATIR